MSQLLTDLVGAYRAYVSPTVAIIGVIGNLLVLLVFCRERQKSRFSIYCIMLAVIHIVCLVMNSFLDDFFGRGLQFATNGSVVIKLDVQSIHACRFMEYLPNVMYIISSFIMVIFSLDRTLTIFKPLRFYSIYYKTGAWTTCFGMVLLGFVLNIPHLLSLGLLEDSKFAAVNGQKCDYKDVTSNLAKVSLRMKVIVAFVIPTLIVFVLNFIICFKLWRVRLNREKLLPGDTKGNTLEMNRVVGHLAVSNAFLFLTLPLVVVMILRQIDDTIPSNNKQYRSNIKDLSRFFSSVKDITYAADFFLYFLFLGNFRWRLLKRLFSSCLYKDWFLKTHLGAIIDRKICRYDLDFRRRRSTSISALAHAIHPTALAGYYQGRISRCDINSHLSAPNRSMSTYL